MFGIHRLALSVASVHVCRRELFVRHPAAAGPRLIGSNVFAA